MIDRET
jgi:hypothetical protein